MPNDTTSDLGADTFKLALEVLKREGKDRKPKAARAIPLKSIKTAVAIFQPRDIDAAFLESDAHIKGLAEAIREASGHTLDPLVVWWSGAHWYVVDGHHRLDAYRQVACKGLKLGPIPVKTFEGTVYEAIRQSVVLNSKDKLKMTKEDKLERAWKLVCVSPGLTKANIRDATSICIRTIATMRGVKAQWVAENAGEDILDLSWAQAKRGGDRDIDEDWEEQLALEWSKRLVKHFGQKLIDQPEVAARALQLYSDRLPDDLISSWPIKARAYVEAVDLFDPDADF